MMAFVPDPSDESSYRTPPEAHGVAVRTIAAIAVFVIVSAVLGWAMAQLGVDSRLFGFMAEVAIWVGTAWAFLREPEPESGSFAEAMEHAGQRGAATFTIIGGGIVLLIFLYAIYPE